MKHGLNFTIQQGWFSKMIQKNVPFQQPLSTGKSIVIFHAGSIKGFVIGLVCGWFVDSLWVVWVVCEWFGWFFGGFEFYS